MQIETYIRSIFLKFWSPSQGLFVILWNGVTLQQAIYTGVILPGWN